jgi:hypothetical protein
MVNDKRLKVARVHAIIMLAALALQYEFGMAFTFADPPKLTPFGFSAINEFNNALNRVGPVAQTHAGWGVIVALIAVASLIFALRTRLRRVQITGVLASLLTIGAGFMGQLFVQSGYQNDNYTHGMATFFLLSFASYFLELYFLKPAWARKEERAA